MPEEPPIAPESAPRSPGEAAPATGGPPSIVLKFGGSSVSTVERWRTIAAIARARLRAGYRPLIVCSALSGVSDRLEGLIGRILDEQPTADLLAELRRQHEELADGLGIDAEEAIQPYLDGLDRLVSGARMIGEVSEALRARVMAHGELMSTSLGAAFLAAQGVPATWRDARELLIAATPPLGASLHRRYLAATCRYEPDAEVAAQLADDELVITQGFIAIDEVGDTVLLGRGGSDTSAAYLAARLRAERLEIWTDVPGLFTANPYDDERARLLYRVGYGEAEVLSAMGARVLHPRCLPPCRDYDIPMHIGWTSRPELAGTVIATDGATQAGGPKAVCTRERLYLVRVRCPGHWHVIGLLAEVTQCFGQHGLSIDLIANSASLITLTLDPGVAELGELEWTHLYESLAQYGTVELFESLGSVSLVGSQVGADLGRLSPYLQPYAATHIEMVSHAGGDDGLSFVLDKGEVSDLGQSLHDGILDGDLPPQVFGPAWSELVADAEQAGRRAAGGAG